MQTPGVLGSVAFQGADTAAARQPGRGSTLSHKAPAVEPHSSAIYSLTSPQEFTFSTRPARSTSEYSSGMYNAETSKQNH
eukprot:m.389578 g.389578  ORF g.389578 m.389578 type:complete len:80 (-) comp21052_c0_seq9:282-521(-)